MDQNQPLGMGAIEREHDLASFSLADLTPATHDAVFTPDYGVPIENQGHQPACGPHSSAEVQFIKEKVKGGSPTARSPKYGWIKVKQIDGFALNVGTDIMSLMKSHASNGLCADALLPNNVEVSLEAYADKAQITPEMDADAADHKITAYAFQMNPTFEQLKQAIFTHKAVILLARIGDEFWTPSWAEKDILPLKTTRPITSGHFVTAYGYDEQYVYFYNHWSASWGRAGIGYFAENYMPRIIDIATTVDVTDYQFTRNLTVGATGTDVGVLQLMLRKMGFFKDANGIDMKITSYFGEITKGAVKKFQEMHPNECLVPAGILTGVGTGNFGTYTRMFFNSVDRATLIK